MADVKAHFRFSFLELSGTSFYKEQFQFSWGLRFSRLRNSAVMAVPCGDERDYAFMNYFKGKNGRPEGIKHFRSIFRKKLLLEQRGFKLVDSDFLSSLGYKKDKKKC
jgi:hypothetical protein